MERRDTVDTPVGRLAVRIIGEGQPAVLWHSLFVDGRSWDRVAPDLARDRRLILITGPGHGESGDARRRYDLPQCARAAVEVLDELGVTEPVDWVGNAWGGHVGVLVATAHAHRVRSLVTIGTPVQGLGLVERVRTRSLLLLHRLLGPAGFIADAVVETLLSEATRANDPEAVALVRSSFVGADAVRLRRAVLCISLHRESLAGLLPDLRVPTLMVTGEQHGGWTPAQAAAAIRAVPDGRTATVPDAAYLVPLERPDAVVTLVRGFWASALAQAPGSQ